MSNWQIERLLAGLFFRRYTESDLLPPGLPQVQPLIWGIALFASPGLILSIRCERKYASLLRRAPTAVPDAILLDEFLFVTLSMMALGLVALVVWESVFPDRRDGRILGALPVPARALVVGRLSALAAIAMIVALGSNIVAALVYRPVLWAYEASPGPFRAIAAHLVSTASAGLFAFFLVITAQGALLSVFGRRVAEHLALILQILLLVILLQAILFIPHIGGFVQAAFHGEAIWWVPLLPPAWFLALYDVLSGSQLAPASYALAAVAATLLTVGLAPALLTLSHSRLVGRALETPAATVTAATTLRRRTLSKVAALVASNDLQRAIAGFAVRTLARSRPHLMLLAMYTGIAVALVCTTVISVLAIEGTTAFQSPRVAILSAPLIFMFVGLCGLRVLVAIPVDIKPNWIFRLHITDDRIDSVIEGARVALRFAVVGPITIGAGLTGASLWDVRTGVMHALFTAVAGMLLTDVVLVGLRKVPFACTYFPGRSGIWALWPLYLGAFSAYAFGLAQLEVAALARPAVFVTSLAIGVTGVMALTIFRRANLQAPPGLTYVEDDPEGLFAGFRLSEGMAAESRPPPVRSAGVS